MDVLKKENNELELQIENLNEELAILKKNLLLTVAGKKENKTESVKKKSDNEVLKHDNVAQKNSLHNKKPVYKIQNKNLSHLTKFGLFSQQSIKTNQYNNGPSNAVKKPQINTLVSEQKQKNIVFINNNLVNKNIHNKSNNKINKASTNNISNNFLGSNTFYGENNIDDFFKDSHNDAECHFYQPIPMDFNSTTYNSVTPNNLTYKNNAINNIAFNKTTPHNNITYNNNITHKTTNITNNSTKETLSEFNFNANGFSLSADNDFDVYFNENLDTSVSLVDNHSTNDIENELSTPPPSNLQNSFLAKLLHKRT